MAAANDQQPESSSPEDRPKRRWLAWLRDGLLVLLVLGAVQWWQSRDLADAAAPPLLGLMVDGSPFQLDPAEGPTLVHFWAEWCPVCRLEQGTIDSIAEDRRVVTVATTSGTAEEVAAFLAEEGLGFPVLMDESGDIARSWGVNGVPATFVVDSRGQISSATMGYTTGIGLRLRLWAAD